MTRILWTSIGLLVAGSASAFDLKIGTEELHPYFGASTVDAKFSISSDRERSGGTQFRSASDSDSKFYRVRGGVMLGEDIGIELQYGIEDDDVDQPSGTGKLDEYLGLFFVANAEVLGYLEMDFPIGFSQVTYIAPGDTAADSPEEFDVDGLAYGVNIALPLSKFTGREDEQWDIKLIGGGMVYQQDADTRFYGYNIGFRFDFGYED